MSITAGRPIHANGTAALGNFQKIEFVRRGNSQRVKKLTFRTTGTDPIRVSFDSGRNFFTVNTGEVLYEEWSLHFFHVQSAGPGASAFEAIGTEV